MNNESKYYDTNFDYMDFVNEHKQFGNLTVIAVIPELTYYCTNCSDSFSYKDYTYECITDSGNKLKRGRFYLLSTIGKAYSKLTNYRKDDRNKEILKHHESKSPSKLRIPIRLIK